MQQRGRARPGRATDSPAVARRCSICYASRPRAPAHGATQCRAGCGFDSWCDADGRCKRVSLWLASCCGGGGHLAGASKPTFCMRCVAAAAGACVTLPDRPCVARLQCDTNYGRVGKDCVKCKVWLPCRILPRPCASNPGRHMPLQRQRPPARPCRRSRAARAATVTLGRASPVTGTITSSSIPTKTAPAASGCAAVLRRHRSGLQPQAAPTLEVLGAARAA